jgi:hypothetical protein
MGRIHPEKTAAIGAEHFHRHKRRQRADHDRLLLRLVVAISAHRGGLQGVDLVVALKGHRHALDQKHDAQGERGRKKDVDNHPPHIDDEAA